MKRVVDSKREQSKRQSSLKETVHMALTLEISSSVQTWSPLILESRQLLIDRCLKVTFFCLSFTEVIYVSQHSVC